MEDPVPTPMDTDDAPAPAAPEEPETAPPLTEDAAPPEEATTPEEPAEDRLLAEAIKLSLQDATQARCMPRGSGRFRDTPYDALRDAEIHRDIRRYTERCREMPRNAERWRE